MKYLNSQGEFLNFNTNTNNYMHHGTSAEIYHLKNDLCLKKYYKEVQETAKLNYEMYKILKKLNHPFTNKVIELYYEAGKIKDKELFIQSPSLFLPDAYTYIYLNSEPRNILNESIEFLIYNISHLEDLMNIFTELKIFAEDIKCANTIFYEGKIVLFDLDGCRKKESISEIEIKKNNERRLILLFKELFKTCETYSKEYKEGIDALFRKEEGDSIQEVLKRRLVKCRTVLEYIKGR